MSRAVVTWSRLGRPEALRYTVDDMPSWRALFVMSCAKLSFVAAQRLGEHDRGIVGRAGHQRHRGIAHVDRAARRQAHLGRRRVQGVYRHRQRIAERQPARIESGEGEVDRHQLGERRRMTQFVGSVGDELATARGVEDQIGVLAADCRIGNPRRRQAHGRLAVRLGRRAARLTAVDWASAPEGARVAATNRVPTASHSKLAARRVRGDFIASTPLPNVYILVPVQQVIGNCSDNTKICVVMQLCTRRADAQVGPETVPH